MYDFSWRTKSIHDIPTQEYLCAYCGKTVAGIKHDVIELQGRYARLAPESNDAYYVLECPSCALPTIYSVKNGNTYPPSKPLQPVKNLSDNLRTIYNEVNSSIGAHCYTAAVVLARTAIMHIAVEHGAKENNKFIYYVDFLVEKGYVPPNSKPWIDKIRTLANDSVHHLEFRNEKEAKTIGNFLYYLLIFVYELPSSV